MSHTADEAGALTDVADLGRVHLIGVGGAGMSAVAALLAARGVVVSGSDARDGALLSALREVGVEVRVGHAAENVDEVDTVVVSTAIRSTNPELARARERGLRVLHRSQALAALMAGRRGVAVAGAHGKTTTSAMIAVALRDAGLDPSFAIGGTVHGAQGAVGGGMHGSGDVFVAEADESDGSFLAYRPLVSVVTNVEPDHLDHYGDRAAFEAAFVAFADRVAAGGWLVACWDDPGSRALAERVRAEGRQVRTYGMQPGADVRLTGFRSGGATGGSSASIETEDGVTALHLLVPGEHNALNATAAWTVARLLGVDGARAARGLGGFSGTGRRFEPRGVREGVRVVDDYAHHPTEVAALLRAARSVAGEGRVLVLFQPHLFSRTLAFAQEFADALGLADVVVVTDVYAAREDVDPAVTGETITALMPVDAGARFVADRHAAARCVGGLARPGDLVLTVGAGDVTELGPEVLEAVGTWAR
ncbi:UDP-N-acetylmuramate--L-alanine ligase [Actinotalea sp. K2]|uniref:UDP-N-acetylmuramate--L-alanine ligase n=1 Tax=Actinotalea sp. K2 TaxID=2939438 RepID=UPI00201776A9|nr:UDP-N-acetylmuramate--L-alanine ligase [Actinotalea sp. K2]MCL3860120.1 UDP-N-acetylmuramate--L-alanine ligase [Actinotalea sp. K2]